MKKTILSVVITFCFAVDAFSQLNLQYIISLNGNLYVPINSDKQTYPILAYDKDADPKFLIGGFGIGFTAVNEWREKFLLKGQANLSRHAYWYDPMDMKDANNNPLGTYTVKAVDYVLGITATAQYRFNSKIALGTGLGGDFMLLSLYDFSGFASVQDQQIRNKNYKTLTPVLPLELSFYLNKVLLNIRYEQGLVNRYRKTLADYQAEFYGLLVFEVGIRIK